MCAGTDRVHCGGNGAVRRGVSIHWRAGEGPGGSLSLCARQLSRSSLLPMLIGVRECRESRNAVLLIFFALSIQKNAAHCKTVGLLVFDLDQGTGMGQFAFAHAAPIRP